MSRTKCSKLTYQIFLSKSYCLYFIYSSSSCVFFSFFVSNRKMMTVRITLKGMQTMKSKLNHTPYSNNSSYYVSGRFSGSLETDLGSFLIFIHDLRKNTIQFISFHVVLCFFFHYLSQAQKWWQSELRLRACKQWKRNWIIHLITIIVHIMLQVALVISRDWLKLLFHYYSRFKKYTIQFITFHESISNNEIHINKFFSS